MLHNDTLRDTKKDAFLISIRQEQRKMTKKRKHEYVNQERCPVIIGTISSNNIEIFHIIILLAII